MTLVYGTCYALQAVGKRTLGARSTEDPMLLIIAMAECMHQKNSCLRDAKALVGRIDTQMSQALCQLRYLRSTSRSDHSRAIPIIHRMTRYRSQVFTLFVGSLVDPQRIVSVLAMICIIGGSCDQAIYHKVLQNQVTTTSASAIHELSPAMSSTRT